MVVTPAMIKGGTENQLNGMWWSSGKDVFAVGQQGTILLYNGSAWTPMASGTESHLFGVWGTPDRVVFAVGKQGVIFLYK